MMTINCKKLWILFLSHAGICFQIFRVMSANQFSSHFITLVLRRACWIFQQLLWIENYNWEICQYKIVAIMTDKVPAPLSLVELSVCKCNCTTLCNSNCCKCYKNSLPRTNMYKWIGCQNKGEYENYEFV